MGTSWCLRAHTFTIHIRMLMAMLTAQATVIPAIDTTAASIETAAGIVESTIATNMESVATGVKLSAKRRNLQKPLSQAD